MNVDKLFHDRESRGVARGADRVWDVAAEKARVARRRRRAAWAVPFAAAAAVAAIVFPGQLLTDDLGSAREQVTPASGQMSASTLPASSPTASTSPAPSPTPTGRALIRELTDRYMACAIAAGFDPGSVQVVIDHEVGYLGVKTGRDVPAGVHRPCLREIGGHGLLASSHGNLTALGACMGIDNTPPIDWRPAPAESFPRSVIDSQGFTVPPGRSTVSLQLTRTRGLRIPEALTVECWNGQRWQPAYVVSGLGDDDQQVFEIESGVTPDTTMVAISMPELVLPVPEGAPVSDYRVVDQAQRCSDGACDDVDFSMSFRIRKP